jgi:hypothetical protein
MSDDRPDDDALLAELRMIADRHDPVPPELTDAAIAAFTWLRVDAELAELLTDPAESAEALAGTRGAGERSLTFRAGARTIEVDAISDGQGFRLVGQLSPAAAATLTVRHPAGTVEAAADEVGRFAIGPIPPGPISLRVEPAAPEWGPLETAWLTL